MWCMCMEHSFALLHDFLGFFNSCMGVDPLQFYKFWIGIRMSCMVHGSHGVVT